MNVITSITRYFTHTDEFKKLINYVNSTEYKYMYRYHVFINKFTTQITINDLILHGDYYVICKLCDCYNSINKVVFTLHNDLIIYDLEYFSEYYTYCYLKLDITQCTNYSLNTMYRNMCHIITQLKNFGKFEKSKSHILFYRNHIYYNLKIYYIKDSKLHECELLKLKNPYLTKNLKPLKSRVIKNIMRYFISKYKRLVLYEINPKSIIFII